MTTRSCWPRRSRDLAGPLAAFLLLGCLTRGAPEKRHYVLEVERSLPGVEAAPAADAAPRSGVCRIDRVRVSALFERKGLVYRTGDHTYEYDFYNEFFAPPGVLLRQTTARWLAGSRVFGSVVDSAGAGAVDWLLEGHVHALYADLREEPRTIIEIEYALLDARSEDLEERFRKTYRRELEAARGRPPEIAESWNASLREILAELEADLSAAFASE